MLRFHLDEHVPTAIAKGLTFRGIDVTTTPDAGLLGCADEQHLEYARLESRVIFTNDADFLRLASSGHSHAGIVYCPPSTSDIGDVVRFLALMSDCLEPGEMHDRVEFL